MRIILFVLITIFTGCNGSHNPRIEEAGKGYGKSHTIEDSALKEMAKMEANTDVVNNDDEGIKDLLMSTPWVLTSICDKTSKEIRRVKFLTEVIKFTADSIFIQTEKGNFAGTWRSDSLSLNIKIKGTNRFNYSIANRVYDNQICLAVNGNSDTLKCFTAATIN